MNASPPDSTRVRLLGDLANKYTFSAPEKGLVFGQQGLQLAQRLPYPYGIAYCNLSIGWCFWALGNYQKSLEYTLKALHDFEQLGERERVGYSYNALTAVYRDIGDFEKAIQSGLESISIYEGIRVSARIPYANLGSVYLQQNRLDSALLYIQKGYELDLKDAKGVWNWPVYLLGNINARLKRYDIAVAYYRAAVPLAISGGFNKDVLDIYNSLSDLYQETGRTDSAAYYSNEVIQKWRSTSYQKGVLKASTALAALYKQKGERDSTIKYLELSNQLNEELFAQDKQRSIQLMAFTEQERQQEVRTNSIIESNERRQNLQFAAIAIGLVCFISIFLLLSRRTITSPRLISFLGVVALLMIFEFINLLLHPFLARITHHSPVLMLMIMVFIAAILVPIHHYLEKKSTIWLIEKNRQLRLEAAKKTIAALEKK